MSRSSKARYGTRMKRWKDTVQRSANQARSRAKWKKVTKKSPKKTANSRKPQKPDELGGPMDVEWFPGEAY